MSDCELVDRRLEVSLGTDKAGEVPEALGRVIDVDHDLVCLVTKEGLDVLVDRAHEFLRGLIIGVGLLPYPEGEGGHQRATVCPAPVVARRDFRGITHQMDKERCIAKRLFQAPKVPGEPVVGLDVSLGIGEA